MDRDELLQRLRKVLDEDTFAQAKQDLDSLDMTSRDSHWLVKVLESAELLPMPEVPPVLSQDLKNLMRGNDLVAQFEAHLVSDSRLHRELAGVRGGEASDGWSLSYTSEVADLVVDLWPDGAGEFAVEGQMMAHGATESAYRADAVGPRSVKADGDRLGRFDLGTLLPGRYDLTISNGQIELTTVLEIEEPQQ